MTTYGIFSDLHQEFGPWNFQKFREGVTYINAGDTATQRYGDSLRLRKSMEIDAKEDGAKYYDVPGNHDYYNGTFPKPGDGQFQDGNIAGATLWTEMSPLDFFEYKTSINDSSAIKENTLKAYNEAFESDLQFLIESKAEIIVTHHSPSMQSCAERWRGDPMNKFFHNRLDDVIRKMKPRLWVHGHTHDPCMYWIDKTQIVCHPRGYPNEYTYKKYQPIYVEV